jgi:hypothetical protein
VVGKLEVEANDPGSYVSLQILHKKEVRKILKGSEKLITIRGIVIPADWDEKGKAVAAAISTHEEEEYLIDKNYKGEELLHYIQEEVEVSGIAKENQDNKTITVQKYILRKQG